MEVLGIQVQATGLREGYYGEAGLGQVWEGSQCLFSVSGIKDSFNQLQALPWHGAGLTGELDGSQFWLLTFLCPEVETEEEAGGGK